jgi:hypothetical protein
MKHNQIKQHDFMKSSIQLMLMGQNAISALFFLIGKWYGTNEAETVFDLMIDLHIMEHTVDEKGRHMIAVNGNLDNFPPNIMDKLKDVISEVERMKHGVEQAEAQQKDPQSN